MAGESADASARRMRAKSERLARSAASYERGAEGERATAAVLAQLPPDEWTVFHDLRWPGRRFANVDHVVVGPAGVFVIDTKNWSGDIRVRADVLRQNGRRRESVVAGVAEAALAVARLTSVVGPHQIYPVLCFAGSRPLRGHARDVMVCSTANVLTMLRTRPRVLSNETVRRLCLDLDASFRPATGEDVRPQRPPIRARTQPARSLPRSGRRSAPVRRARRRGKPLARLTGFVATVSVMLAMLTTDLPDHIAQVLVTVMTTAPDDGERAPGADDRDKGNKQSPNKVRRQRRERSDQR